MFEAFGDDSEGKCLNSRDGFVTIRAVAHDTSQAGHFREPATVVFPIELNRKSHVGTVTSGLAAQQALHPTSRARVSGLFVARSSAARG